MSKEMVSREEVMKCFEGEIELYPDDMPAVKDYLEGVKNRINNLPSVAPQLSSELDKNSKKLEKTRKEFWRVGLYKQNTSYRAIEVKSPNISGSR